MNDLSSTAVNNDGPTLADSATATHVGDDYKAFKKFLAEEEESLSSMDTTSLPGGDIAFSNRHCATDEEADAALEAFLMKEFGVSDEDE